VIVRFLDWVNGRLERATIIKDMDRLEKALRPHLKQLKQNA